jgi:hypothetical protein
MASRKAGMLSSELALERLVSSLEAIDSIEGEEVVDRRLCQSTTVEFPKFE